MSEKKDNSKDKKGKLDANSPFAKLKAVKEKLAAEEAAAKASHPPLVPRTNRAAGVAHGASPRANALALTMGRDPGSVSRGHNAAALAAEEDAIAFHRLVSGVTPLGTPSKRIPRSQEALDFAAAEVQSQARAQALASAEAEARAVTEHLRSLVEGGARFEVTDDGHRVEGRRVEIPADVVRKLRRGLLPIDARLDLHGLRAGDARDAIESFLRDKRACGERCTLIVHGKGEHSPSGQGVLRGEIAAWLSQTRASDHVAAFATAVDGDGGEGAVYVLLRR
jgi:DNA-nicking Smr family endonuclease